MTVVRHACTPPVDKQSIRRKIESLCCGSSPVASCAPHTERHYGQWCPFGFLSESNFPIVDDWYNWIDFVECTSSVYHPIALDVNGYICRLCARVPAHCFWEQGTCWGYFCPCWSYSRIRKASMGESNICWTYLHIANDRISVVGQHVSISPITEYLCHNTLLIPPAGRLERQVCESKMTKLDGPRETSTQQCSNEFIILCLLFDRISSLELSHWRSSKPLSLAAYLLGKLSPLCV